LNGNLNLNGNGNGNLNGNGNFGLCPKVRRLAFYGSTPLCHSMKMKKVPNGLGVVLSEQI